jgi:hypothetical protein
VKTEVQSAGCAARTIPDDGAGICDDLFAMRKTGLMGFKFY